MYYRLNGLGDGNSDLESELTALRAQKAEVERELRRLRAGGAPVPGGYKLGVSKPAPLAPQVLPVAPSVSIVPTGGLLGAALPITLLGGALWAASRLFGGRRG